MKNGNIFIQKLILRKKEIQHNDRLLNEKLSTIKSKLSTDLPHSFTHNPSQAKKEYLEATRNDTILSENKILLSKLNRIAFRGTNSFSEHNFDWRSRTTTLNEQNRKIKQKQIQADNIQMLRRLQNQKPSFRIRSSSETQTKKSQNPQKTIFSVSKRGYTDSVSILGTKRGIKSQICQGEKNDGLDKKN